MKEKLEYFTKKEAKNLLKNEQRTWSNLWQFCGAEFVCVISHHWVIKTVQIGRIDKVNEKNSL